MSALSGQTPSKFNYINLTYTIDSNGFLKTLNITEQYEIVVVVTVTGTATITETFYISDTTTILTDVNLDDIRGSLTYQVKSTGVSNISHAYVDMKKSKNKGEENENN